MARAVTTIPDQQAIINFDNGLERLIIDTAYAGEGTNFAWIVPLPSAPTIEASDASYFSQLSRALQPIVRDNVVRFYLFIIVAALTIYVSAKSIARNEPELADIPICMIVAAFVGWTLHNFPWAVAIFAISALARWIVRSAANLLVVAFLYAVAWVFLSFLEPQQSALLMTLGVETLGKSDDSVQVLERKQVGAYDTATIASTNSQAIVQWLHDYGFAVAHATEPVFASYIKQGWVFAAMRIHRDDSSKSVHRAHPLMFTFATKEPVYPLRLTGVDNGRCKIDLYVYAADKAVTKNFSVTECRKLIGVPVPAEFTGSVVLTKLEADLTPSQMTTDRVLEWKPFEPKRNVLYSYRGAVITASNVFALLFALVCGAVASMQGGWQMTRATMTKIGIRATAVCLVIAVIVYWLLPKTEIVIELTRV